MIGCKHVHADSAPRRFSACCAWNNDSLESVTSWSILGQYLGANGLYLTYLVFITWPLKMPGLIIFPLPPTTFVCVLIFAADYIFADYYAKK